MAASRMSRVSGLKRKKNLQAFLRKHVGLAIAGDALTGTVRKEEKRSATKN